MPCPSASPWNWLRFLAVVATLAWSPPAESAEFDAPSSTLDLQLGTLFQIEMTAVPTGTVFLHDFPGGHYISIYASENVWRTFGFEIGTAAFAGAPQISNASLSYAVVTIGDVWDGYPFGTNPLGGGQSIGPAMGGYMIIWGELVLRAMEGSVEKRIDFDLGQSFYGHTTTFQGYPIAVSQGPALTAPLAITGITTNVITVPARGHVQGVALTLQPTPAETVRTPSTNGGFASVSGGPPVTRHTVTVSGSQNLLSAQAGGFVTLVTPFRVQTGAILGGLPGAGRFHFRFVPEPGSMLLLISGLVGLFGLARLRRRG